MVNGLLRFDGSEVRAFNTDNSLIPDNAVNTVAVDNYNVLWMGTMNAGLVSYDGTGWSYYNVDNSNIGSKNIKDLAFDHNGNLWLATRPYYDGNSFVGGGLVKKENNNFVVYDKSNSSIPSNYINAVAVDAQNDIWVGTFGGAAKFDGTNWTLYQADNSGLPNNFVLSIAVDASNNKWFGLSGGGLVKFDGTNWTVYNTKNSGIPCNSVSTITIDRYGNKWIGTVDGLGVFREGGVVMALDESQMESPDRFSLAQNYPNPFNPTTTIRFALARREHVTLKVFDLLGRQVAVLVNGVLNSGEHRIAFNARNLPSGMYIYRLQAGDFVQQRKMILLK